MPDVDNENVKLDPAGGVPDAEIYFGQAQAGRFSCYFQDANGHQALIKEGGTASGSDIIAFSIGQPAKALIGNYICWDITIVSPSGGTNEQYLLTITIRQSGSAIKVFQETGSMTNAYQSLLVYVGFQ
jgi:hypothetical protein